MTRQVIQRFFGFRGGLRALAVLLLSTLTAVAPTRAQESRGSIAGRVTDSSGAIVPGATVVVTNPETNVSLSTRTDISGRYTVSYLLAARYTVSVELLGFKKVTRSNVEVRVADKLTLDLVLETGEITETVEVVGAQPLLDFATGSAGQVVDSRQIELLPLADGNPFMLTRLAPGVSSQNSLKFSRAFDNQNTSNIVTDGTTGGNEFTLDGSPNMMSQRRVAFVPPTDAVEEFKVETITYDAQQGHTAGATVNVSLKSGTNKFHGTLYEFNRDDKLAANDFFLNRAGTPRAPLNYNRFGGSLGGPVLLPGYNGKDRTFFFATYEGLYDQFPEPRTFTVPTEAERTGDFSALLAQGIVIYDPLTATQLANGRIERKPFTGNVIPAGRISPVARQFLNLYPSPNRPGDVQGRDNFIGPNGRGDDFYSTTVRLDHRLTENQRVSLRYAYNHRKGRRNNWSGEVNGVRATGVLNNRINNAFIYDHVWSLSPTTLLNWRLGFMRYHEPETPMSFGDFDPKSLGFSSKTASYFGDASYVPLFSIGQFSALGGDVGSDLATNVYSFQPTLSRTAGRHWLRVGYDLRLDRENVAGAGQQAGRYDFAADFTKGPQDNSLAAPIGQELASFLLGIPTGGLMDRNASGSYHGTYHALFVQDDWRVTDRLTLNLGLRYEYEGPVTERENRNIAGFDTTAANPIEASARTAYAQNPIPEVAPAAFRVRGGLSFVDPQHRALWKSDKNNFQPRAGFSFRLNDKTALRGGLGLYTVPLNVEGFNQTGFSQATNIVPTLDTGLTFRASLTDPFPDGVTTPPGASLGAATFLGRDVTSLLPERKNAQYLRWSAGFQRLLPRGFLFEASYVGSRGYDLPVQWADGANLRALDLNTLPRQYLSTSPVRDTNVINFLTANVTNPFRGLIPGTTLNGATVQRQQLLRPFPQFLNVGVERNDGTSMYHAGQFRIEKRFSNHYSVLLDYTYSRYRDKVVLLNATDTQLWEGPSSTDTPHRFAASAIWEPPLGKGRALNMGRILNAVFGDLSLQGVFALQSGRPLFFGNLYYDGDPQKIKATVNSKTIDQVFDTTSGFYFHDAAVQTNGVDDPAKQQADTRIRLANNIRTFPLRLDGARLDQAEVLDCSLIKTVSFGGDVRLQIRIEALNAFNHPVFDVFARNPQNSNFGKITAQDSLGRNIQLGVKLIF